MANLTAISSGDSPSSVEDTTFGETD